MHLLGRMLAFDPGRRISAEEALCHEYFAALEASALNEMGGLPCLSTPPAAIKLVQACQHRGLRNEANAVDTAEAYLVIKQSHPGLAKLT